MSWATEFPEELLKNPNGFISFTGLDIVNNPTHKSIWEAFSSNRGSDRPPLHFKLEENNYENLQSKPKRPSYDWYIPKGLLKTGWMKKHLEIIPSLVMLFIDCDWHDPLWKAKLPECVNGVKFIRNQLNGRSTKVGLVLIQKNVPLPPGEDVIASERAATLCSLCDLPNNLLFVLHVTESLLNYTVRLELAFADFSKAYYHSEARRVKAHKDLLNKTTHALLFVRHQFKIAFYNEMKQDFHAALKHYKQGYSYVQELRLLDFNILEIKTIAGFINYKICKLNFFLTIPLEAISQFRKHIDFFKTKLGIPELIFEHTAWMSKQFQIFGDLFDEAIKQGLAAILTQHPGIYYQQAAHHAANRRSLSLTACQSAEGVLNADFMATLHALDFYGQRPWRQGQQSIEAPDVRKEKEGIFMLQLAEKQVNHSKIIIPLLGSAVTHAKRYKSPRMKRHLLVQLMNEYYFSHEYAKALSLVSRASHEYRNERWWMVLTSILSVALKCAYLAADVQHYVTVCLELVGIYSLLKHSQKLALLNNLTSILQGGVPDAEAGVDDIAGEEAWRAVSSGEKNRLVRIDVANIIPFVECKVQFSQEVFQSDSKVIIHVFVRSQTVKEWSFERLSLTLNNEAYNTSCVYNNSCPDKGGLLTLQPGEFKCISFSFLPLPSDVGSQIEVTSVVLEMGPPDGKLDDKACRVALVWTGSSVDTLNPSVCLQGNLIPLSPLSRKQQEAWNAIKLEPFAKVSSRKSQVDLQVTFHEPAFVHEVLRHHVSVRNLEKHAISNLRCNVILDPNALSATTNCSTLYVESLSRVDSTDCSLTQADVHDVGSVLDHQRPTEPDFRNTTTVEIPTYNSNVSNKTEKANDLHPSEFDLGVFDSDDLPNLRPMHPVWLQLDTSLPVQKTTSSLFFSRTRQPGKLCMLVSVTYDIVTGEDGDETTNKCMLSKLLQLSVLEPVEVAVQLLNLKMEPLAEEADGQVRVDHCFLLTSTVRNLCATPLSIQDTRFVKNVGIVVDDNVVSESFLQGEELQQDEVATESFFVSSNVFRDMTLPLGTYHVKLVRKNSGNIKSQAFTKSIQLPRVVLSASPLYVDLILPSFGTVHANLFIYYSIRNMTSLLQELVISMQTCEGFMFSGHRQVTVKILPLSNIELKYNLVPLVSGKLSLPILRIVNNQFPDFELDHHRQTPLPSTIFIKPQSKKAS